VTKPFYQEKRMSQYQITLNEQQLALLFQNDALQPLLESVLNQVLQAQVSEQLNAQPYERTDERQGYRNGTRERAFTTRVGTLQLQVPKLRAGTFTPDLFDRYARSEQALLLAMVEMVLQGVSTRKVSAVVEELCGASVSKSTVSALCERLQEPVNAWRERSLAEQAYPFVLVDALVIKVRKDGQVRRQSLLIATGINAHGYREIVGLALGDSESEASWGAFFCRLKQRGLSGVDLVVSDSHTGLVKALDKHFQGASWQRCQTHLIRNVLVLCPKRQQAALAKALRRLFDAETEMAARQVFADIAQTFGASAAPAVACLEAGMEEALTVLSLPERYRKRLRTTNSQERLNEEIRRRERVIRIFPNEASAERLLGALLMEFDETWSSGSRYFDMDEYGQFKGQASSDHLAASCVA
jgi:transposase-like protein